MYIHFPRVHIRYVYEYIKNHSGQTILRKDFTDEIPISRRTLYSALQWLKRRGYIAIDGKKFYDKMH